LGVLGGAFNPPHMGHLVLAQEAHAQLGLGQVLLVPVGKPGHREIEPEPGSRRRLEMTRLAAEGDERLDVSAIEVERDGICFTADTLAALREQRPDDELVLIMGADQAAAFGSWRDPDRILELGRVAVAAREDVPQEGLTAEFERLGARDRVDLIEMPRIDVSSSTVRERLAAGRPIRYLVPEAVAGYIEREGLYS